MCAVKEQADQAELGVVPEEKINALIFVVCVFDAGWEARLLPRVKNGL